VEAYQYLKSNAQVGKIVITVLYSGLLFVCCFSSFTVCQAFGIHLRLPGMCCPASEKGKAAKVSKSSDPE